MNCEKTCPGLKPCGPPTEYGAHWWTESIEHSRSGWMGPVPLYVGSPPRDQSGQGDVAKYWSTAPILAPHFWRDHLGALRIAMMDTGHRVCDIGGVWLGRVADPHENAISKMHEMREPPEAPKKK